MQNMHFLGVCVLSELNGNTKTHRQAKRTRKIILNWRKANNACKHGFCFYYRRIRM